MAGTLRMEIKGRNDFQNLDEWAAYLVGTLESELNSAAEWRRSHMESDREEHKEMRERIGHARATADSQHEAALLKLSEAHKRIDRQNWILVGLGFGSGAGGALSARFIPPDAIVAVQHFVGSLFV